MMKLAVLVLASLTIGCASLCPPSPPKPVTVTIWPGWQVNNFEDLERLTQEGKGVLMQSGSRTLAELNLGCPFPPPDYDQFQVEQHPELGVTQRALTAALVDRLSDLNPEIGVRSVSYERHECISGHWVCKLPTYLSRRGTPLVEKVTIEGIEFELEYDLTLVWSMR